MYKAKQFSENLLQKKDVNFLCHFGDEIIASYSLTVTTNDSFDDGFKLKSLILAQNERWRQA